MAALSERKLEILRSLVETAPDHVVDGLSEALADASSDSALAGVRLLVETERSDRQLRNVTLMPIAPMCVGDGSDPLRLTFPARVAGLIWRGLKAQAPVVVRNAEIALVDYRPGASPTEAFDRLVKLAAKGIRAGERREFQMVSEICDAARPGGSQALLGCLDLTPLARAAIHKLPEWTLQSGGPAAIGARLAFKDASAVAEDAGPRLLHMLAAHLQHPWRILRIIAAITDKPTERYLHVTELAIFGEIVLRDIEQNLDRIAKLDPDAGPASALQAARGAERLTTQASELETYVTLARDKGWGQALVKHRKALASQVEARLHEAEKAFAAALPCGRSKVKGARGAPKLDHAPDQQAVLRCETLLTFASEVRTSANAGGFASARTKFVESLGDHLDHYVDDLVDLMKTGGEGADLAPAYLAVAADVSRLVRDERAAELVRRRTAVAAAAASPMSLSA